MRSKPNMGKLCYSFIDRTLPLHTLLCRLYQLVSCPSKVFPKQTNNTYILLVASMKIMTHSRYTISIRNSISNYYCYIYTAEPQQQKHAIERDMSIMNNPPMMKYNTLVKSHQFRELVVLITSYNIPTTLGLSRKIKIQQLKI